MSTATPPGTTSGKPRPRGRSLGFRAGGPRRLIERVREGFEFIRVEAFQEASGLSLDQVARFTQIPKRTLSRRQSAGRLQPDESDRLLRLATLFDLAVDLFEGDAEAARQWMTASQPGLGGESPWEFASTEVGAREVERLILRLEHGVFA